jgi:hypothetical protein
LPAACPCSFSRSQSKRVIILFSCLVLVSIFLDCRLFICIYTHTEAAAFLMLIHRGSAALASLCLPDISCLLHTGPDRPQNIYRVGIITHFPLCISRLGLITQFSPWWELVCR